METLLVYVLAAPGIALAGIGLFAVGGFAIKVVLDGLDWVVGGKS